MMQEPLEAARSELYAILNGEEWRCQESLKDLRERAASLQEAAFAFHVEMGQALFKRWEARSKQDLYACCSRQI